MDPGLSGRADELRLPLAVHPDAVEEALRGVLGGSSDVKEAVLLIDRVDAQDVVIAGRQELDLAAVAADGVGVPPAIALAQPEQALPAAQPDEDVHALDPRLFRVGEDRPDLARGGGADEDVEHILQAVEG